MLSTQPLIIPSLIHATQAFVFFVKPAYLPEV